MKNHIIKEKIKVIHIADTHLFMDDERGIPFLKYSSRMAKAYNQTMHFKTREKTNPKKAFKEAITYAKESGADLVKIQTYEAQDMVVNKDFKIKSGLIFL